MLSIRHINKQYATQRALDDVSLEIPTGSVFGLLGPNGAGKTSLIRIINQITAPDSGEVFFENEKLQPKHIARIGYLPEERGLYKKMEVGEQTMYLARLKGLSKTDASNKIKYWFEKMQIESWWNKKVEELSKGMQQKIQFISTVVHNPSLIILDEPFSGFDPINAELIKNEILELNHQGATIIFSTHRMESVEEMCDSIALIHQSKKILDGKVKDIKNSYRSNTFFIEFEGNMNTLNGEFHQHFSLVSETTQEERKQAVFKLNNGKNSNDLLHALLPHVSICSMKEVIPSINDIFISTVK